MSDLFIDDIGFGIQDVFRTRLSDWTFTGDMTDGPPSLSQGLFVRVPSFEDTFGDTSSGADTSSSDSCELALTSRLERLSCGRNGAVFLIVVVDAKFVFCSGPISIGGTSRSNISKLSVELIDTYNSLLHRSMESKLQLEQLSFMYRFTSISGLSTLLDNIESDINEDDDVGHNRLLVLKLVVFVGGVGGGTTRVTLNREPVKNVGELPVDKLPPDNGDKPLPALPTLPPPPDSDTFDT